MMGLSGGRVTCDACAKDAPARRVMQEDRSPLGWWRELDINRRACGSRVACCLGCCDVLGQIRPSVFRGVLPEMRVIPELAREENSEGFEPTGDYFVAWRDYTRVGSRVVLKITRFPDAPAGD